MHTRIIAFGGRKYSGKSVAAKMAATKLGCNIYSFASELKKICARILDISVEDLSKLKNDNTIINYDVTPATIKDLTELTGLHSVDIMSKLPLHTVFTNVRDMLQIIGTDVICKIDTMYWAKNIMSSIERSNKDYAVIDDLRFYHEMETINENNGRACFIIRPVFKHINNHSSENSLLWDDYDNIIVNYVDTPENGIDLNTAVLNFINANSNYSNITSQERIEGTLFGRLDNEIAHIADISYDIYNNNKDSADFINHGLFKYHPDDNIKQTLKNLNCERINGEFYSPVMLENFKAFVK